MEEQNVQKELNKGKGKGGMLLRSLRAAFPHTIPILAGFSFLGMSFGVLMKVSGFPTWMALLMSITIFAGSMEFVAVGMLLGVFHPVQAFLLTLMINARHLFYGIAMLDKYKDTGLKKFYLIFAMCDESFSINCSAEIPGDVDSGWFMTFVNLLDQIYWVGGTLIGCVFGSFISFNTEGLDFVMTAMFVVIFLDQWLKEKDHVSSLLGLGVSLICLILFGADNFIVPSMAVILLLLTIFRGRLEEGGEAA